MLSFVFLEISSSGFSSQLLMSAAISILGMILSYIFIIPVMQNKIETLKKETENTDKHIHEFAIAINDIKNEMTAIKTTERQNGKFIDELFDNEQKNTEKFTKMIQLNTEAIVKLEATLKSLNDHTAQMQELFKNIINKGKTNFN